MNRKLTLLFVALILVVVSCAPPATPATPAPAPAAPASTTKNVTGSKGTSGITVPCTTATGKVAMPAGSFSNPAAMDVTIACISQGEKADLEAKVKAKTKSTNEIYGAIKLEPSPFDFDKSVTLTIPLYKQLAANKKLDIYVYAPDLEEEFLKVSQAVVESGGWTAKGSVSHFSIFLLIGDPATVEEPTEPDEAPTEAPAGFTCDDAIGCIDIAPGDPIRIASLLDFTGEGELSASAQDGVNAAASDYGGISGHGIEVTTLDGGCNEEEGASAAYQVTSDPQIVGVVGTICSASANSARVILSDAGYTMVSPGNTRSSFTYTNPYPGYFRVALPGFYQAQVMADFAYNSLGVRRVGIFRADATYGQILGDEFSNRFREMGGDIVADEVIPSGTTDMYPFIAVLEAAEADAVYMPLFLEEARNFTGWVREFGMDYPLLGTDAINTSDYFDYAGSASENVYFTDVSPSEITVPFAYGYDAAYLLLAAIARVAVLDADGTLHIGRQALREALLGVTMSGRTGEVYCNRSGDCGHAPIAVYLVKEGQPSEVSRYTP